MRSDELMQTVIDDFVRRKGIRMILTKEIITGPINVYYYNWTDQDSKYYSLLVPCNDTQIFSDTGVTSISTPQEVEKAISKNLRQFYSKGEWDIGKWDRRTAENFNANLNRRLNATYRTFPEPLNGYKVVDVKIYLRPCVGVTIWYQHGTLQSFTVWLGYHLDLFTSEPEFKQFIEQFDFGDNVTVHVLSTTRAIQIEETFKYDDFTAF